jgi:hypothetical protein
MSSSAAEVGADGASARRPRGGEGVRSASGLREATYEGWARPAARPAAGSSAAGRAKWRRTGRCAEAGAADGMPPPPPARQQRSTREEEERRPPPASAIAGGDRLGLAAWATVGHAAMRRRREGRRLREEQDAEYENSLLADQIRDIERADAEERERREEEEMKRRELARRAGGMDDSRTVVACAEEPPANAGGVARLRFALPDGRKVDRRFLSGDTIRAVRAFLLVHFHDRGVDIRNVGLVSNFPKREFDDGEDALTLEEAGLAPQAMVMVRDLDA